MRECLKRIAYPNGPVPSHFALAYDAWAPVEDGSTDQRVSSDKLGKISDTNKASWLDALSQLPIADNYRSFYDRWKASFLRDQWKEIAFASRLLVGHGNPSATEVGLTVHHTWGVPIIPGSALKGLCAHYTAATYGQQPLDADAYRGEQDKRPPFRGPQWDQGRRRVIAPPGDYYRALFGAPDVDGDASAGLVTFHEALYVPDSIRDNRPFAVDVLTVHQRSYYGQMEGVQPGERWPNDYDSPNPVAFISVKPGAQFLFAVSGEGEWPALALDLLTEAIRVCGVGGKTSAGYGRGA